MTEDTKPGLRLTDTQLAEIVSGTDPPPPVTEAMREAFYGPQDNVKSRPTLEICALCHGAGLVTPRANENYRTLSVACALPRSADET